jgi:hypothetical protein
VKVVSTPSHSSNTMNLTVPCICTVSPGFIVGKHNSGKPPWAQSIYSI